MDVYLLKDMGLHPKVLGPAELPDFQIRIGDRATLVPNPESTAYGVVMELSDNEAATLYSKPDVSDYQPETVSAILISNGTIQRSSCYNLPLDQLGSGSNVEYAEKLSMLVLELGFSSAYASEINS